MIKVRVQKLFLLLLASCFLLLIINRYLHTNFSYVSYTLDNDPHKHRFPHAQRHFTLNSTLTLYSSCLCQKEVVTVEKLPTHYTITVHNVYHINTTNNLFAYNISIAEFEAMLVTCDLYKVLRRGPHQNVVAYSLRDNEDIKSFQNVYLINVKTTVSKYYRNWIARIYYDSRKLSSSDVCSMECSSLLGVTDPDNNVDFCDVTQIPFDLRRRWDASFMPAATRRWLPIGDGFVDVFVSRDVDVCTYDREMAAVKDWIEAKTLFHTMRDHYTHDSYIMPGLWGLRTRGNRAVARGVFHIIVENAQSGNGLLEAKVWPIFRLNSTVHDSYFCETLGGQPFPVHRTHVNCYVGMFGCCGSLLNQNVRINECPESCRPKPHRNDWIYC